MLVMQPRLFEYFGLSLIGDIIIYPFLGTIVSCYSADISTLLSSIGSLSLPYDVVDSFKNDFDKIINDYQID